MSEKNYPLTQTYMNRWHALPLYKKRIYGFLTYQFAAFASLYAPIEVDKAMHKTLNEQFKDMQQ